MSNGARDLVLRVALALWVGVFIAFLGTSVTTFNEPLRLVAFWAYGLPIVLAAAYCLTQRATLVDLAVLVALATLLAVSWMSGDRIGSLESAGVAVAYASTFIVASRVTSAKWRSSVGIGAALPVAIWMLAFAAVWSTDRIEWIVLGGGVPPHIAQSAHMWLGTDLVAVLLLLGVPFYPWIQWTAFRRILIGATALAAIAVVPMSDARTTWIAAIVGLVAFAAFTPRIRSRAWPPHRTAVLATCGVVLLAGVIVVASGAVGTLSGRANIWATAVATFASSPITGTGPATFSWTRLAYTPPFLEPFPVFHAHNLVLQTLADGGVILLTGLAVAVGTWLVLVVPASPGLAPRTRLCLVILIAFAIVVLLDTPMQLPALAAMALVLAGWVAADAREDPVAGGYGGRFRWVAASALLVAAAVTIPSIFAASEARAAAAGARTAAIAGNWGAAHDAFSRAVDLWPSRAPYRLGLGLASAELGSTDEARVHYEAAARLSPGDPRSEGALAALADESKRRTALLERAARLMSRDPQYRYRLAAELSAAGRDADAVRELARAVMIDPQVLTLIAESWDAAILTSVLETLPDVLAAEAGLMAIDPVIVTAQADVLGERIDGSNPPSLVALAAAHIGDEALAAAWMDRALKAEPYEERTYEVGVAIAEMRCDEAEAHRLRTLGEIAPGGFTSLYWIGPELVEARDHIYREMGLGDYQPPSVDPLQVSPHSWPRAFLAEIGCVGVAP